MIKLFWRNLELILLHAVWYTLKLVSAMKNIISRCYYFFKLKKHEPLRDLEIMIIKFWKLLQIWFKIYYLKFTNKILEISSYALKFAVANVVTNCALKYWLGSYFVSYLINYVFAIFKISSKILESIIKQRQNVFYKVEITVLFCSYFVYYIPIFKEILVKYLKLLKYLRSCEKLADRYLL